MGADEFWTHQPFSYLETYSFNRGPKRAALILQTKEELRTARYMRQPALRQVVERLESGFDTLTQGLHYLHPTATKVATVSYDSVQAQQLAAILSRAEKQEVYAMCWPIYRDALALYDAQGRLVRVLNICFECMNMKADTEVHVEADLATYEALRAYLVELGHPIE
jgi:hypothetical protein